MRSVSLFFLASFAIGLLLAKDMSGYHGVLISLILSLSSLAFLRRFLGPRQRLIVALSFFLLGSGLLRFTLWQHALPGTLTGGEVQLVGRVAGEVTATLYHTRLVLHAEEPGRGKVRVTLPRSGAEHLGPGDRVLVAGTLMPVRGATNPHGWDGRSYWHGRGVYWELRGGELLRHAGARRIPLGVAWQQRLDQTLDSSLPEQHQGLMRALLMGDRSQLDVTLYEQARRAGIAHLFAVSGLHVGMVGAVAAQLVATLGAKAASLAMGTLAILGYGVLCGPSPSIVRAGLMYLMGWIIRPVCQRETLTVSLCLSAFIMLLIWPTWLFTVGFQLSFGAVLGIALWGQPLQKCLSRFPRGIRQVMATTIAVQLMTIPVLAAHFGEVSFSGLVVNPVAMPLALLGVVGGLAVAMAGVLSPFMAWLGGRLLSIVLVGLTACAQLGSRLPLSAVPMYGLSIPQIALYYGAIMVFFSRLPHRRYLVSVLVLAFLLWPQLVMERGLEVIFFDVGHGDAILFRVIGGPILLVDTGRGGLMPAAEYSIIPYLKAVGARHIDVLAITHAHDDHYGGARSILEVFSCQLLLFSAQSGVLDWPPGSLKEAVLKGGGQLHEATAGDCLRLGPLEVEVLHPPRGYGGDENDSSLVLQVRYASWSALLTGDISVRVEEELVRAGAPLASEVLKVAHHGSSTSSGWLFLRSNGAQHAVIQSGDRFGHPDPTVVDRLERSGMWVWRTDQQGAIIMRVGRRGYDVYGFSSP